MLKRQNRRESDQNEPSHQNYPQPAARSPQKYRRQAHQHRNVQRRHKIVRLIEMSKTFENCAEWSRRGRSFESEAQWKKQKAYRANDQRKSQAPGEHVQLGFRTAQEWRRNKEQVETRVERARPAPDR